MKRKNILIIVISFVLFIVVVWYFSDPSGTAVETIQVEVENGDFVIDVTTTGELEARSSEKIQGPNPMMLRNARIWDYTIEDIVLDGTIVDSGDWVATLDRSVLENKIKDQELEVEKLQTQFIKTQLDTTLTMRNARDELINLTYSLEEKQIIVDQSIYEPPATQRQVKLDYEKTMRTYNQTVENYSLKYEKAKADMKEVAANLAKSQREYDEYLDLMQGFSVRAPKSGMVTYKRGFDGKKVGVGGRVSAWENVVATLPNLSAMNSKTYVNEIDISKVAVGQKTELSVDAFPGKVLFGVVNEVANMGEQLQNSNAKVFEVIIHIDGYDSILRPSMTTKNRIITQVIKDALFVPIECVQANDSITYVYKGSRRQQIIPGKSNENSIEILAGLEDGDKIYLVPPAKADEWQFNYLDKSVVELFEPKKQVEPAMPDQEAQPEKPEKGDRKPGDRKGKGKRPNQQ